MRLILTRHGRTEENEKGLLQGQMPGKLSKKGIEQARKLAKRLKAEKIDAIYSSDLSRAIDTAQIIAKNHKLKVKPIATFREFNFGKLEGTRKENIDWSNLGDDVESPVTARKRAKKTLDSIYRKHKGETVVLVGHGGINRAMIALILKKPARHLEKIPMQYNTAVNIFEITEDKHHKIHLLNCTKHLEEKTKKKYLKKKRQ
jgi:broad specificity phosphatase PhoE